MLYMYSPEQNTGKSILYEGFKECFEPSGFAKADSAIKNESGFNKELYGSALCVIEETNLAGTPGVYGRLKAWVTSDTIQITKKGQDGFVTDNFTHWIMTTNNRDYLPIDPGDTRVVMWEVPPFAGAEVPREEMLSRLKCEAPHFLRQLYRLDISAAENRHTLPVLLTEEKQQAMTDAVLKRDFSGLPEIALKAVEAISKMSLPWTGTATELCGVLGDWDGRLESKSLRSRSTQLGMQMKRIEPTLDELDIRLKIKTGKNTTYSLSV